MTTNKDFPTLQNINLENIFQNFLNILNKEINDLRSLEIITVTTDNLLIDMGKQDIKEKGTILKDLEHLQGEQNVKILARTHYELDGDIVEFLPMVKNPAADNTDSKAVKENTEIMAIHNKNVERALKNQQDFIKIMTEFVSQVLIGITGKNGLKGLGNLMDIFVSDKNKDQ